MFYCVFYIFNILQLLSFLLLMYIISQYKEIGKPYLILGANNKLLMQDLLNFVEEPHILHTIPDSLYIMGKLKILSVSVCILAKNTHMV